MTSMDERAAAAGVLINLVADASSNTPETRYAMALGAVSLAGGKFVSPAGVALASQAFNALAAACNAFPGRDGEQMAAAWSSLDLVRNPWAFHNLSLAQTRLYCWCDAARSIESALAFPEAAGNPYFFMQAAFIYGLMGDGVKGLAALDAAIQAADCLPVAAAFRAECMISKAMIYGGLRLWADHFKCLESRHELSTQADNPLTALARAGRLNWRERVFSEGGVAGDTVYIVLEWGIGDQIQFARLVSSVAIPGVHRKVVVCSSALCELITTLPGCDSVMSLEDFAGLVAYELSAQSGYYPMLVIPVIDLMALLYSNGLFPLGSFYAPYLSARGRRALARVPGKIAVTFNWQGDKRQLHDFQRRVPLAEFGKWAAANTDRYTFHSVQTRFAGFCDPWEGWPVEVPLQDCSDGIENMADVAHFIAAGDVHVGQCGANVHLAGAMGHPTVLLCGEAPDWRWSQDENLYPLEVVKQSGPVGDWSGSFGELEAAIGRARDSSSLALGRRAEIETLV